MQQQIKAIEVKGLRVLTTEQLAESYGTTGKILQYNFSYNKKRYVEGKHYIALQGEELRSFKANLEIQGNLKYAHILYLWTEKGALLHAKSLNTDKAWEVYDYLVDFYFRVKDEGTAPAQERKSGTQVVDVPENAAMQKAIQEVRNHLTALDVVMQEYNAYRNEDSFRHLERTLDILRISLGRKMYNLMELQPKVVIKEGY